MDGDTIKEVAKATGEPARTAGKGIDAAGSVGTALTQFFGGLLTEGSGMITDRLQYMRWERKVRLSERATQYLQARGLHSPTRAIPLKLAVPLLEAATLEEDNALQDVWAGMLANAANADHPVELTRSFIVILEQLTTLEVQLFERIYAVTVEGDPGAGVYTAGLPVTAVEAHVNTISWDTTTEPQSLVRIGLANLQRLGCLRLTENFGCMPMYRVVFRTELGYALHAICAP